ncbi:hypothetical protein [Deinococcus aerophilus]|uniref:DUF4157 domain-containing protein n=1 Tax=Deinococcus aerophilus TaxID=522488 RepID=A0ABQ2GKI2_9DEIO|nr:hypothetical protein [Deinococcus aerophilus]GGM00492.1 hypothetical protein GCM10010841_06370 [Deinococcus aerophilus]
MGRAGRWSAALTLVALWAAALYPTVLCPALAGPVAGATRVQRGGLSVSYTDPRDRLQLGAVFRAWEAAVRDLGALGLSPPGQVTLEAAGSAAEFAQQTGKSGTTAASTRGAAISTQRLTALAQAGRLPATVRHEAFHTAQPPGLPRWLAEGLARTFSGEARSDPPGPTGLAGLSGPALDARLQDRDPARQRAAYLEATRRAQRQVKAGGWRAVLGRPPVR